MRGWRARPAARVLGVDIDGDILRVAEVDGRGGKQRLVSLKRAPLRTAAGGPLTPEARALLGAGRRDPCRLVIFVPRSRVTVREIVLPSSDPDELRRMAPFEAARLVPHSAEELLVDFDILASHEDGSSTVRLVIAREDDVRSRLSVLEEAGVEPDKIEVSTTALARLLHRAGERSGSICYLGDDRLDMLVLKGDRTEFSRGVDIGRLGERPDEVAGEITRSTRFARKATAGAADESIRLVAATDHAAEVRQALNGSLSVEAYELPRELLPSGFEEEVGPYLPAIGAALDTGEGVNLLPRALLERRLRRARIGQAVIAVSAGLLALLLLTLLADRYLASAERTLDERRAAIEELEPRVQHVSELQDRARAITEHLNPDFDALEVFTELHRIVPPEVTLYHMHLQLERGRLGIKGQTGAFPAVWTLLDSMAESPIFADVRSRYAAKRRARGEEVVDFSIDAELSGRVR